MTKTLTKSEREALFDTTFANQRKLLERGNALTREHLLVLQEFAYAVIDLACGRVHGRWAIGAPPGTGKSSTIAAFIAAAIKHDLLDRLPMLVCQRTARALTELQNDVKELLDGRGIADDVGIYYTTNAPAEAAKCAEPIERQDVRTTPALLISHSRVLTGEDRREFTEYQGVRRTVLFDESFVRAEGYGIQLTALQERIAGAIFHMPEKFAMAHFLVEAQRLLKDAVARADEQLAESRAQAEAERGPRDSTPISVPPAEVYVDLPELSPQAAKVGLAHLAKVVPEKGAAQDDDFRELVLVLPEQRVRIVRTAKGGTLLQWRMRVHPAIEDVLVFDASYPIRQLCQLDETLKNAETEPAADGRPLIPLRFPISDLVDYRNVKLRWRRRGGGRASVAWDHLDARAKDEICGRGAHLAKVLHRHRGERVAIITHPIEKKRQTRERCWRQGSKRPCGRLLTDEDRKLFDHAEALKADLRALDVDLDARVPRFVGYTEGGAEVYDPDTTEPRLVWLTWGSIEGRNDARGCSVIYIAGVTMRDRERDLKPTALGMMDAIDGEVTQQQLRDLEQSEAAHLIYQAALRGTARENVEGIAKPCTVYVTHWNVDALRRVVEHMKLPRRCRVKENEHDLDWLRRDQRMSQEKRQGVMALVERLEKLTAEGAAQVLKTGEELKKGAGLHGLDRSKYSRWLTTALEVYEAEHPGEKVWQEADRQHLVLGEGLEGIFGGLEGDEGEADF